MIDGVDATQQPVGRVGRPEDIAEMVMFLCSKKAGFITGENICIDGGMTKLMIYHGEHLLYEKMLRRCVREDPSVCDPKGCVL